MILKAKNIDGFYSMAPIISTSFDENGDEVEFFSYYTIPKSRTILYGTDGDDDLILHYPDSKNQQERLKKSDEYLANNLTELMIKSPELSNKCISVKNGGDDFELLEVYISKGGDVMEISEIITNGEYYIGINE